MTVEIFRLGRRFRWRIRFRQQVIEGNHSWRTKKEARENLGALILELRRDDFLVYDLTVNKKAAA